MGNRLAVRVKEKSAGREAVGPSPQINVRLGRELYEEAAAAASAEPLDSMAAFVREVFRCGWRVYQREGSLKRLKALDKIAASANITSKKYSAETCEQLATMVNLILQFAPSTVVKKMTEKLSEWASSYSDSQK